MGSGRSLVHDFPFSSKRYGHGPQGVTDNEEVKILWDFTIEINHEIHQRRPDVTLQEKNNNKVLFTDIAVPGDTNVGSKERERKK